MPLRDSVQTTAKPKRRLMRTRAYEAILDAILDGRLEPGELLRDSDLSAWLGLSRTPIREALNQLAAKGLIEQEVHRYTRVAPLDAARFEQSSEALTMLVNRLSSECARRDVPLAELNAAFAATQDPSSSLHEFTTAASTYCVALADVAGNPVAAHAVSSLLPSMQRMVLARPERFDREQARRDLARMHEHMLQQRAAAA
ncbi:GntR family transcriptional regulator [Plantibacter sp. YIM 135249]|uniref:GntR family transcriptional regulator n=1 Tax=Plantibacter sp. YIM 135249 TaxID=3423918 RepID=UPI003D33432B